MSDVGGSGRTAAGRFGAAAPDDSQPRRTGRLTSQKLQTTAGDQLGELVQQQPDTLFGDEARDRRAQAMMAAPTEAQVGAVVPLQIEPVWVIEDRRVAIRGRNDDL